MHVLRPLPGIAVADGARVLPVKVEVTRSPGSLVPTVVPEAVEDDAVVDVEDTDDVIDDNVVLIDAELVVEDAIVVAGREC